MSSINRRRNGLMALSVIWGLLSWVRFEAPRSQDRTLASATLRDPSLATNYRESGLVHRRILPVPPRSGGGRLTERTPAVQPRRRERVKVPHTRRSQSPSGWPRLGRNASFPICPAPMCTCFESGRLLPEAGTADAAPISALPLVCWNAERYHRR